VRAADGSDRLQLLAHRAREPRGRARIRYVHVELVAAEAVGLRVLLADRLVEGFADRGAHALDRAVAASNPWALLMEPKSLPSMRTWTPGRGRERKSAYAFLLPIPVIGSVKISWVMRLKCSGSSAPDLTWARTAPKAVDNPSSIFFSSFTSMALTVALLVAQDRVPLPVVLQEPSASARSRCWPSRKHWPSRNSTVWVWPSRTYSKTEGGAGLDGFGLSCAGSWRSSANLRAGSRSAGGRSRCRRR
jgi:hypothetical protein